MKDELFQDLLKSVREGGAILRGEQKAARTVEIKLPDASQLRREADAAQHEPTTDFERIDNREWGSRRCYSPFPVRYSPFT